MGLPVLPHDPRPVDGEHDVLPFDRRRRWMIWVEPALQKGRIDREHRLHPARGESAGKGDRVFLRDPHVEEAVFRPNSAAKAERPVPSSIAAVIAQIL